MRSHSVALQQFLKSDVQGDWNHLATLMSAPKNLELEPAGLPERFYAQDAKQTLNEGQKQAVAGAIATPHAFFIQGPPGTGKTTVIVETIQHLVARGERVLMLAPTHVAVDEVLQRVGDEEDIMPIRLAWDETKVRDEVRRYTESQVRQELGKRVRRPSTSLAKEWGKEREALQATLVTLSDWKASVERHTVNRRVVEDLSVDVVKQEQLKVALEREAEQIRGETQNAEVDLEVRRKRTQECRDGVDRSQSTVNQLEPRGVFGAIKGIFTGQLRQLGRAKGKLGRDQQALNEAHEAEGHSGERVGQLKARQNEVVQKLSLTEQQLSALKPQLARAQGHALEAEQQAQSKTPELLT
jgi:hypothetical protein